MNRDDEAPVPLVAEAAGWLAFVVFVASVWKVRQILDRWNRET